MDAEVPRKYSGYFSVRRPLNELTNDDGFGKLSSSFCLRFRAMVFSAEEIKEQYELHLLAARTDFKLMDLR